VNTTRRSYLAHIALLCVAVVFSRTARATASVNPVRPCTQHCSTKVAAEPPALEKKLPLETKNETKKTVHRTSSQSTFAFAAAPQFLSPRTALMQPSHQTRQALPADQTRFFVLRI